MSFLESISQSAIRIVDRYVPEPFSFAIFMTLVTAALCLLTTPSTTGEVLSAWGNGLSALLPFITQMALMILFAYALAQLHPIPKLLKRLASVPSSPRAAYVMVCIFTGVVSLVNWPLGLILGGVLVRSVGEAARDRGIKIHYPLLAGAAFSGFVVWHMGYSASAPLFVATTGNAMEAQLGGLIPVTDTIFAPWNIATAIVTLIVVAWISASLHPRDSNRIVECPERPDESGVARRILERRPGPASWLESSRLPTLALGLALSAFLTHKFLTQGLQLDLNVVNWTFFALGALLATSPTQYAEAVASGGRAAAPVLLQYPLYGGVMGIMLGSGFVAQLAPTVAKFATEDTLPLLAFLLGGLINFFIPSGGAQWTVQGPAFVAAATELGTDLPLVVMGVAYGDQWTNIIHPFTVIPIMILTGLKARQILAYSAVMFVGAGITLGTGLYLAALFS